MHYKKSIIKKMHEFFLNSRDRGGLPSMVKFAAELGVSMSRIEQWMKIYPDFENAVMQARACTIDYLIDCGLNKTFEPGFIKYLLSDISLLFPAIPADSAEHVDINITVSQ